MFKDFSRFNFKTFSTQQKKTRSDFYMKTEKCGISQMLSRVEIKLSATDSFLCLYTL